MFNRVIYVLFLFQQNKIKKTERENPAPLMILND
nr:MAG TPA: hypothetical protein [Bacteriophage sp.]